MNLSMDKHDRRASAAMTAERASATTPRERLVRALRGQPADRVPGWLMRQAGRYLPEYNEVRRHYGFLELCKTPAAAAEVSLQPLAAIGSDAVIIFNDILVPLEAAGARVEFDDRGPLIRNPIQSGEALARLDSRPLAPDEPVARSIAEVRRRAGGEVPILGFIGAPWTLATYWVEGRVGRQFETVGALRFRDPALLEALLERITPVAVEYLKLQVAAGADAVQIFDTWGSLLGQDEYERFSGRWIRRIIEEVKPLGAPVIVFVNGCAPYLAQLATLGADALSVDWRVGLGWARERLDKIGTRETVKTVSGRFAAVNPGLKSGANDSYNNPGKSGANDSLSQHRLESGANETSGNAAVKAGAAETAGDAAVIALQGNLDPLALLAGPEAAERAVRDLFAKFPPGPGYVFNLGHGILPNTPVESARRVMEAVKQYGAY